MVFGLEILGLTTAGVVALGAAERLLHQWRLSRIPVRIHVSGTRGKSSVTRLIAAGLRQGGVPTVAKTTGTLPRLILADGREVPVFRPAGASIIEQTRIVAAAAGEGARALVIECMALQPEYHWISENRLVRATIGVITNCRADHLDVMGPEVTDVARTLAGMIPVGGTLFTAERRHLDILALAAADRGSRLVAVGEAETAAVTGSDLAGFGYTEHAENVALALAVTGELGVPRPTALAGMRACAPDPGALTEYRLDFFGRRIVFLNAFAANDPESTASIWRAARTRHPSGRALAVFNLRGDRPARTVQMARETDFWHDADRVVLFGSGAYLFARMAAAAGFDQHRLLHADFGRPEDVFERILEACGERTLVVGMGNIGGLGLDLVRHFRNRAVAGGAL